MTDKKVAYTCAAGILYSSAFFCPYMQWGVWASFVFLFMALRFHGSPFFIGFFWGICSLTGHISLLSSGIMHISQGSLLARLIVPIFICIYLWTTTGLWFFVTQKLVLLFKRNEIWIFSITGLILFLTYHSLAICGQHGGFFFLHPFIPFAQNHGLSFLLQSIPQTILLTFFIATAYYAGINNRTCKKAVFSKILGGLCLIFFIFCSFLKPTKRIPDSLSSLIKTIHVLDIVYPKNCDNTFLMHDIFEKIFCIQRHDPLKKIFLLTESSCYSPFKKETLSSLIDDAALPEGICLLMGGFRAEENNLFNTLFFITSHKELLFFDKKELLPFVEYIPSNIVGKKYFLPIFFAQSTPLSASSKERPLFEFAPNSFFVPYICSELFMAHSCNDNHPSFPIIACSNDRHFCSPMTQLMEKAACLRSLLWQRPIIFITSKTFSVYTNS